jgi:hypothetical protein
MKFVFIYGVSVQWGRGSSEHLDQYMEGLLHSCRNV